MGAYDIYNAHLAAQISAADAPFVEAAIFDPGVDEVSLFGWFDEHTFKENSDSGHVSQYRQGPRFIVATVDFSVNVYENKILRLVERNRDYVIQNIDYDANGVQVIWLR